MASDSDVKLEAWKYWFYRFPILSVQITFMSCGIRLTRQGTIHSSKSLRHWETSCLAFLKGQWFLTIMKLLTWTIWVWALWKMTRKKKWECWKWHYIDASGTFYSQFSCLSQPGSFKRDQNLLCQAHTCWKRWVFYVVRRLWRSKPHCI